MTTHYLVYDKNLRATNMTSSAATTNIALSIQPSDECLARLAQLLDLMTVSYTWTGARSHTYRFFEASLQILDLNFLLKRDMADGVPLLTELVSEVMTVTTRG